jgi:hypothetical protein
LRILFPSSPSLFLDHCSSQENNFDTDSIHGLDPFTFVTKDMSSLSRQLCRFVTTSSIRLLQDVHWTIRTASSLCYQTHIWECIQKFPDWVDNEIYAYNNKNSWEATQKVMAGKKNYTDSQNSDTTASSGRELYHLQFSLQAASPETFGYTLVFLTVIRTSRQRILTWGGCIQFGTTQDIYNIRSNTNIQCRNTSLEYASSKAFRTKLFTQLYCPVHATCPSQLITDLIPIWTLGDEFFDRLK